MEAKVETKVKTKVISDKPPTLVEAQEFVGGLVELVQLYDGRQILVDEEGLLKDLPHNPEATQYLMEGGRFTGRYLVGNALILEGNARWGVEEDGADD